MVMSNRPVSVFDIAQYIIKLLGPVSAMKLQKLVYYSQAWSLVWDESPLFTEPIEAWISGPVVPVLYREHKGKYLIGENDISKGNAENLNKSQKLTIVKVLKYYGKKNSQWLSDLTHSEDPWKEAREGLDPDIRGDKEISLSSMQEYYSSLK
jgi:uncharacterized phage-associated protein